MVGLDSPELAERLFTNPTIHLYCHPVTSALIRAIPRFEHLTAYIRELPPNEEHLIHVARRDDQAIMYNIVVTLIPAGHCPGSVMFLIKGDQGTVLYTGDFRIHVGDAVRIKSLFCFTKGHQLISPIQSVYIDTTFCVPEAMRIPTREDCKKVIVDVVKNWFGRKVNVDRGAIAHIYSRSSYGYEFLMVALAEEFRCRVHVCQKQYEKYRFVPSIQKILTTDAASTKIHFCQPLLVSSVEENLEMCKQRRKFDKNQLPCIKELDYPPQMLQIIP